MADRQPARRPARRGRETAWQFFRTLLGLLLVAWLVVGLFSPPHPLPFLVGTAILWLVAVVATWWLVARGGYGRLRESPWYDPGLPATTAVVLFVALAVTLKLGGTALLDQVFRGLPGYVAVPPRGAAPPGKTAVRHRPYVYDLAASLVSLVGAYLLVYRGALAWLLGEDGS